MPSLNAEVQPEKKSRPAGRLNKGGTPYGKLNERPARAKGGAGAMCLARRAWVRGAPSAGWGGKCLQMFINDDDVHAGWVLPVAFDVRREHGAFHAPGRKGGQKPLGTGRNR